MIHCILAIFLIIYYYSISRISSMVSNMLSDYTVSLANQYKYLILCQLLI